MIRDKWFQLPRLQRISQNLAASQAALSLDHDQLLETYRNTAESIARWASEVATKMKTVALTVQTTVSQLLHCLRDFIDLSVFYCGTS